VTSTPPVEAYAGWGAYGASKAALEQLGRIWAAELAGTGVRVINVDPGEMNTRMHAEAMPDADPAALADPAAVARRLVTMIRASGLEAPAGATVKVSTAPAVLQ
jgi:NAD(P)-dependent dehydrogenase (short-subunit alcohol dehydrogenase family)